VGRRGRRLTTGVAALFVGTDECERVVLLWAAPWPDLTASEVADAAMAILYPILSGWPGLKGGR
jgi:hypothetical protein